MLTDACRTSELETARTTELELVNAARRGHADAFGMLFENYKNAVYSFVRRSVVHREDAEDIVQEVFCRAWNSIARFRGDAKFLSWLYRIAANLCLDRARSKRAFQSAVGTEAVEIESIEDRSRSIEEGSLLRHSVDALLASLPTSYRMLVVLCDIEGYSSKEAATILGCSSTSVRVRLCRAHQKMRKLLPEILDGELI